MSALNNKQKIISLNGKLKTSGTASSPTIIVDMPVYNNFNRCSVIDCEVPKSYYMLDTTNNSFSLQEVTGSVDQPVTLKNGSYGVNALTTELTTKLNAASVTGGNSYTYVVSFNSDLGIFTFTNNGVGEFSFTTTGNADVSRYLGLIEGVRASVANSLVSTEVINLQRYDALFITSNFITNNNDQVLCELWPEKTLDFDSIRLEPNEMDKQSLSIINNSVNTITLNVIDTSNNLIDLNGRDIKLKLLCWQDTSDIVN